MSKSSKVLLLFVLVFLGFGLALSVHFAGAANSHSIDLESSSSQYLSISDASQTGLDLSTDFSFEAWIKIEQLPSAAGSAFTIIDKFGTAANVGGYRVIIGSTGFNQDRLTVYFWNPSGQDTINYSTNVIVDSADVGKWVHIAGAVDISASSAALYKNSQSISVSQESSWATTLGTNGAAFGIGANVSSTPTWFFDGLIDDVRLWNDIRTSTEIANNYQKELVGDEANLVGYWKLNNDLLDATPNNNNLTNNNGAIFSTDIPFTQLVSVSVRKSTTETVSSDTTTDNDGELFISLAANKGYIIDGVVFATSTSAIPDIKVAFIAPTGAIMDIGAVTSSRRLEFIQAFDTDTNSIPLLANQPIAIQIIGTVKTGSTPGTLAFQWAQNISNVAGVSVLRGSYLRADEL